MHKRNDLEKLCAIILTGMIFFLVLLTFIAVTSIHRPLWTASKNWSLLYFWFYGWWLARNNIAIASLKYAADNYGLASGNKFT